MKDQFELLSFFCSFVTKNQSQFKKSICILRSYNVKEYFNLTFNQYLSRNGIIRWSSCPIFFSKTTLSSKGIIILLRTARTIIRHINVHKDYDRLQLGPFLRYGSKKVYIAKIRFDWLWWISYEVKGYAKSITLISLRHYSMWLTSTLPSFLYSFPHFLHGHSICMMLRICLYLVICLMIIYQNTLDCVYWWHELIHW